MKRIKLALGTLILFTCIGSYSQAQIKKTIKTRKTTTHVEATPKYAQRNLGSPSSVSDIKDIQPSDNAYNSVKNLVDNKVMIAYDDNTFKGNEPLRRGDFVITFNSALDALKSMKSQASVDSNVLNTFDRNRGGQYLTTVSQLKDVNEGSIYYPASKSLIENYGIGEPFLSNKTLNPSSVMTEKEVYDILHNTLGYTSAAFNPYSTGITRNKFAVALNNAFLQKGEQIAEMHAQVVTRQEAERRAQQAIMDQQEKIRKDSISRVVEAQKVALANQELATKTKIKKKGH